jgi:hypothetical protein
MYGAFVWARRALSSPKRRFPARAVEPRHRALGPQALRQLAMLVPVRRRTADRDVLRGHGPGPPGAVKRP